MGQPLPLLLVGFVDDFFMFCLIGEICGIQITQRPIHFCKFIGIDGLYLYLDGFDMVQDDMTELMVEIVNVFDILERGRLRKNIVLAERQRIAADTVIIVPQQKILCFGFILDGKAA